MFIINFILTGIVAVLTLSLSLFCVIIGWWFVLFPKYHRLKIFEFFIAIPWIFIVLRIFFGIRLKIEGKNNVDRKRTTLYICNHQSWVDVPILFRYSHSSGISKKEARRIPFIGALLVFSGGLIIVDRDKKVSRLASVKEIMRVFKKGFSIFLFPEGTRSRNGKLLRPNKAIIRLCHRLNIPVVPTAIEGTRSVLPRKRPYLKFFQKVVLKFGEPFIPSDYNDDLDFSNACWEKVKELHADILENHFTKTKK